MRRPVSQIAASFGDFRLRSNDLHENFRVRQNYTRFAVHESRRASLFAEEGDLSVDCVAVHPIHAIGIINFRWLAQFHSSSPSPKQSGRFQALRERGMNDDLGRGVSLQGWALRHSRTTASVFCTCLSGDRAV